MTDKPVALLLGDEPAEELGYRYERSGPHQAVVIGSMTMAELLCFANEEVYRALFQGLPVYLVPEGLEHRQAGACPNRLLWSRLLAAERQLQQLGIRFVRRQTHPRLITAQEAKRLHDAGQSPPAGSRLTPLAQEILGL